MDFFQKFIATLDYDAAVVSLRSASAIVPRRGPSVVLPIILRDSLPYVEATMKLRGHTPVRQFFLLDTSTGDAINDDGFGLLGGAATGPDLGRAEYFQIQSYRFKGVNGTSGPSKLGGELLRRFLLTIEVPHRRLFLMPSRHFGDAFLFDTSGLDLERSEKGLRFCGCLPELLGKKPV
jgi:hypothetical protein